MSDGFDQLPAEMRARYRIEMTSGLDLEIGRVYRFREVSGEDIIAGGEIKEKRPGDKGTSIYTVELSCLNYDVETMKARAFELDQV